MGNKSHDLSVKMYFDLVTLLTANHIEEFRIPPAEVDMELFIKTATASVELHNKLLAKRLKEKKSV